MRVLYLTFLESVTRSGLYETQVKQLVCKLGTKHGGEMSVSHFAFLPTAWIGRIGILVPFIADRKDLQALKKEYLEHGVSARFLFSPVIILNRWAIGICLLSVLLIASLPILIYRISREKHDLIHCRSYMATALALLLKLIFKDIRVMFDVRGFWPEEGVVQGWWKENSVSFRMWKGLERYLFRKSDVVIALSDSFADHVRTVCPEVNCAIVYSTVDVEKAKESRQLREVRRQQLGFVDKTVFVYNGSLGSWHDPALLAKVYGSLRHSLGESRLLVLTKYDKQKLEAILQDNGISIEEFRIIAAKPDEVGSYLGAADYGMVPLRDLNTSRPMNLVAHTMIGTKVSEYLACGLPIIVNQNVGGIASLMKRYKLGIIFDSNNFAEIGQEMLRMQEGYRQYQNDCEIVANRYFSLDQAVHSYFELYKKLLLGPSHNSCDMEMVDVG
jgi:glycosyltransferase involved in cell wall biosynthesis